MVRTKRAHKLADCLHDNAKSLSVETMRSMCARPGLNVSEGEQASASAAACAGGSVSGADAVLA